MQVLTVSLANGNSVEYRNMDNHKVTDSGVLLVQYTSSKDYTKYVIRFWPMVGIPLSMDR